MKHLLNKEYTTAVCGEVEKKTANLENIMWHTNLCAFTKE